MAFDIQKIVAAKKAYRHVLATRDILEKLQMLDAMRERAITLRAGGHPNDPARIREDVVAERYGKAQ